MSVSSTSPEHGNPDVSVIIVSYNTLDWTRRCLTSLYDQTRGVSFEVILLDNASSDGSADMVRSGFPKVRLLQMDDNLGFARGVNVAASSACGRYVLLLNPDAEVVGDVLRHLVDFADERPQHGVYGGRTLKPEGGLNPTSCWDLPSLWSLACFAAGLSSAFPRSRRFNPESLGRWQRDTVRTVGMVAGCLLLIRRSLWEQLGGFDTAFFMYGEDADLCARAAKLGCSPVITPGASIIHAIGASTDRRADKMTLVMKAKVTFLQKHWRAPRRAIGVALLRAGVGLRAGLTRLTGSRNSPWGEVWDNRAQWVGGYDGDGSSPRRTSESEPTAQPS